MNRRELLRLIALGTIGTGLDPEELIWAPRRDRIFVPSFTEIDLYNAVPIPGTWGSIVRTTEPLNWKRGLNIAPRAFDIESLKSIINMLQIKPNNKEYK